ncbi:hypothetical protein CFOL_v3_12275 [Cephalotus follicularis]|uniref:Uncharacterized protein n=1 Tax=Cephalotus follicularis TaxID=3775 RepID=A0A1Q3BLS8_CEPFO|nr:hypothetical protein CFOL_v3_12275 [Cephalotus follicularis]
MIHAFKIVRTQPLSTFSSYPLPSQLGKKTSAIKFRQVTTMSSKPDNKDKEQNPNEKTGDVMSHSFGEGYATRSDEEGFGGIYGDNQSQCNIQKDEDIHESHPAYDKSQGSEVKEKEKARHQTNASN